MTGMHGVPAGPGPQLVYTTRHTAAGPAAGWACLACGWWHPQPDPPAGTTHVAAAAAELGHTPAVCAARQHQP